jgi:ABC-type branched-subunit amino acid transport system substrate-binding protein
VAVIWTGSARGAADLAAVLPRVASEAMLVLDDRARTPGFAETSPAVGEPYGLCPCVDLGTTSDPAAQGFLHEYQAATGLDPGPFAAEGFDAGRLLASAAVAGSGRDQIAAALAATQRAEGLMGPYVWDVSGHLQDPVVRMFQRAGVRWLERPASRVARRPSRA